MLGFLRCFLGDYCGETSTASSGSTGTWRCGERRKKEGNPAALKRLLVSCYSMKLEFPEITEELRTSKPIC